MIVIADETKLVETLGAYPLPIDSGAVRPCRRPRIAVERLAARLWLGAARSASARTRTDPTSPTADISFSMHLLAAFRMQEALANGACGHSRRRPKHGLFLNMADAAIIASQNGARTLLAKD